MRRKFLLVSSVINTSFTYAKVVKLCKRNATGIVQTVHRRCAFLKSKFCTRHKIGAVHLNSVRAVLFSCTLDRSIYQDVAYDFPDL